MSIYQELACRIKGAVVPIPVFLNEDQTLDYNGVAKYLDWFAEKGIRNFCLTFTYSMLDMISSDELVELSRVSVKAVNGRGVVLGCTGGGPVKETLETVRRLKKTGIDGLFVHATEFMLQNANCGSLYVTLVQEMAKETDLPLLVCALPNPWQTDEPMLTMDHFDQLVEVESFVGWKDDMYNTPIRIAIAERYGDRLCSIGGGDLEKYMSVHHLPNQSEFAGFINPGRGLAIFEHLTNNDQQGAKSILKEDQAKAIAIPAGLHWLSSIPLRFYAMGFAASYQVRLPLPTATEVQAEVVFESMRKHPDFYGSLAVDDTVPTV